MTVNTPGGHEQFFAQGGVPVSVSPEPPAGPPDLARPGAAAAANGVEILGEPPFGEQ